MAPYALHLLHLLLFLLMMAHASDMCAEKRLARMACGSLPFSHPLHVRVCATAAALRIRHLWIYGEVGTCENEWDDLKLCFWLRPYGCSLRMHTSTYRGINALGIDTYVVHQNVEFIKNVFGFIKG